MTKIQPWLGFNHPFSSMLHFAGALYFGYRAFFLIRRCRHSTGRAVPVSIFAFSCILLLAVSGVYHLLNDSSNAFPVFQRLDHAAIFLLIAGSFTPLHIINFQGFFKWGMLLIVWLTALGGLIAKTIFFHSIPEWFGLTFYLGLGWIGVVTAFLLWRKYGFLFITPLIFSGLFYTLGALIEFWRQPTVISGIVGAHEILHVSVLLGIGLHWRFVVDMLDRVEAAERNRSGESLKTHPSSAR
ncbi:MAG: PAQR family membrane homeostasis protein TrhA [Gammaproteobacteria bacterium]